MQYFLVRGRVGHSYYSINRLYIFFYLMDCIDIHILYSYSYQFNVYLHVIFVFFIYFSPHRSCTLMLIYFSPHELVPHYFHGFKLALVGYIDDNIGWCPFWSCVMRFILI